MSELEDAELEEVVERVKTVMVFKYGAEVAEMATKLAIEFMMATAVKATIMGIKPMPLATCVIETLSSLFSQAAAMERAKDDQRSQN